MKRPVLAVVHNTSSASPRDLVATCRDVCDLVFVWDVEMSQPEQMRAVLTSSGTVVDGTASEPETLARRLRNHGFTNIVTFSDRTMPLACALAGLLDIPYHRPDVVEALTDKTAQRARLHSRSTGTPHWPWSMPTATRSWRHPRDEPCRSTRPSPRAPTGGSSITRTTRHSPTFASIHRRWSAMRSVAPERMMMDRSASSTG
ncbi:MAG TPA: hypothetical protein VFR67_24095 [Pilimelia sp.]|nr:hypothetical protein [Pilimelia sp.]